MEIPIRPYQLQFFRANEVDDTSSDNLYYVLGEFDYFSVIDHPIPDNGLDAPRRRPSSAVLVNWVKNSRISQPQESWDDCVRQLPEAYICRIEFGAGVSKFPIFNNIDTVENYINENPPEAATGFINNQLSYIDRVYGSQLENVVCFQSIGSYSVYIIIDAKRPIQDSLSILMACASINSCQIAATTTMGLVNASLVEADDSCGCGEAQLAQILINVPSSKVPLVKSEISRKLVGEYQLNGTLGDFDFALQLNMPLRKLAALSRCLNRIPGVVATTILQWSDNDGFDANENSDINYQERQLNLIDAGIDALNYESSYGRERESFIQWKHKLEWIIRQLQSALENPTTQEHVVDLTAVTILDVLHRFVNTAVKKTPSEQLSFDVTLDILASAIMQRKQPRLLPPLDYPLSSITLSQGANIAVRAISRYLSCLFDQAKRVFSVAESRISTNCAVVFDYEDGFLAYPHHLFSLPFAAAFTPFSGNLSWQTLSHEVSHSIATDLELEHLASVNSAQITVAEYLAKSETDEARKNQFLRVLKSDFKEIVAHWLDANCFYFGDVSRYLSGIWATWKPRIDLNETRNLEKAYIGRSFVIYCSLTSDFKALTEEINGIYLKPKTDWRQYYSDLDSVLGRLYDRFSAEIETATKSVKAATIAEHRTQAISLAGSMLPCIGAVAKDLPISRCQRPELTSRDLARFKAIERGVFDDGPIDSPLLLLQELFLTSVIEPVCARPASQLCALLALANCQFVRGMEV